MIAPARERLAKVQADLVRALVQQGPVPAGFDEARVRAAARSLVNKRRQALVRAWPALVSALGDAYTQTFSRYAESQPLPGCANPRADGRAFLRWVEVQAPLSDALRIEAIAFDLRFAISPQGVRPRVGFGLKMARLQDSGKLVIAARLPWLGERWWGVPSKPTKDTPKLHST